MVEKEVVIKVKAKNLTKGELGKVKTDLKDVGKAAQEVEVKGAGLKAAFAGWGTVLAGAVTSGIRDVIAGLKDLLLESAKSSDIDLAFRRLTQTIGVDAVEAMEQLRRSTRGLVEDTQLQLQMNKLIGAGMRPTIEQMGQMAEAARVLAKTTGKDTAEAFDLVTGAMITGRAKSLAAAGAFIDVQKASIKVRKAMQEQGQEMTGANDIAAKRIETMEVLAAIVESAGEQELSFAERVKQGQVAMGNFIDNMGIAIGRSPAVTSAFKAVGIAITEAFGDKQQGAITAVVRVVEELTGVLLTMGKIGVLSIKAIGDIIFKGRMLEGFEVMLLSMAAINKAGAALPGIGDLASEVGDGLLEATVALSKLNDKQPEFDASLNSIITALEAGQVALDANKNGLVSFRDATVGATNAAFNQEIVMRGVNKSLEIFNTKGLEVQLGLEEAFKNAASPQTIARQFGSALEELARLSEIVGKDLTEVQQRGLIITIQEKLRPKLAAQARKIAEDAEKTHRESLMRRLKATIDAQIANTEAIIAAEQERFEVHAQRTMSTLNFDLLMIEREGNALKAQLNKTAGNYDEAWTAIENLVSEKMAAARDAHNTEIEKMEDAVRDWQGLFEGWLESLPDLLVRAFTGGGGVSDALKALSATIGGDLGTIAGENISDAVGTFVSKGLGKKVGAIVGGIMGPLGGAIGSLVGASIGKLTGALFGRAGRNSVEDFAAQFGGFDGLRAELAKLGDEGERLWINITQGVGSNNKDQALAAISEVTAALKEQQDAAELAANEELQAREKLQAAVERYGFTVEELGPTWRKQRLREEAQGLLEDFAVLTASGIDVDTVIRRMGGAMNEFVLSAMRSGSEIPEAMRATILRMIELGKLVDEDGNKIESLEGSGISFGMTLSQGFQGVIDKLTELIKVITGDLGDALDHVPALDIPVNFVPGDGLPSPISGRGGETVVRGAAAGGLFSKPTLRVVGEKNPEMVGEPELFIDAFVRALQRVGGIGDKAGGGLTVNINALDSDAVRRSVRTTIGPELNDWYRASASARANLVRTIG